MQLRYYQEEAIQAIFDYWGNNDGNPLVDISTGGGKSLIMADLTRRLIEGWPDMRVMSLTHVSELIKQNFEEFVGICPFADAGIFSAGLGQRNAHSQVIFAGIQTVYNKAFQIGHIDVIEIDEAHLVPPNQTTQYGRFIKDMLSINPDLKIVGFTATPYRMDSGLLTDGKEALFDEIVYTYGIGEGVRDGYLTQLSTKGTDFEYDLKGVGKLGGDYKKNVLQTAVDSQDKNKAVVDEIVSKGANRRSWLAFCSGVEHAYHIRDEIRSRGISCETITGDTPKDERRQILEDFKSYKLRAVTNNSVLCLDEKTEILTRTGWVGIDDMSEDHLIAAWDDDHSIEFTPPELIVRRDRLPGEKMVSVKGVRNDIRVTANHRMIHSKKNGGWSVSQAEDLVDKRMYIPVSGVCDPEEITINSDDITREKIRLRINGTSFNNRKRGMKDGEAWRAAVRQTYRLASFRPKSPSELTEADCNFIGFWLGDGTLSPRCEFSQSTVYPYIIDWFDNVLAECGYTHSRSEMDGKGKQNDYIRWSIARGTGGGCQATNNGYHEVEPYLNKEGSDLLWGLSREQLDWVMYGFWMADGNHAKGDTKPKCGTRISATQLNLFEKLQAVGACRGLRMSIKKIPLRNLIHTPQYSLCWRECSRVELVTNRLSFEHEWKEERVWCVTSSTGRLITRRGGLVSVVGNTTGFNHKGVDLIAALRPTLSASLYVQMIGRGTRAIYAPNMPLDTPDERRAAIAAGRKPNCLVLDFARLVNEHGPVDCVDPKRPGKGDGEAPFKLCPQEEGGCGEKVHTTTRECPTCGFEFEFDTQPKIETRAADAPIMSIAEPEWREVSMRTFRFHEGKGEKPPTVKVTFMCGLTAINEWICPQHKGFPKNKADRFWQTHGGQMPFPNNVLEWIERQNELTETGGIQVEPNGRYWNVIRHAANDNGPDGDNNNEPVDMSDLLDDEIPF